MPRAFLTNSHVSAQFLEHIRPGTFMTGITVLRGILMVGTIGLMAYATTIKAFELMGEPRVTLELELPFYPFWSIIAVAMWCSAAAALIWLVRTVKPGASFGH